ncbi:hypothetical protein ACGFIJ_30040 [Microbispora bryophytorum]|uniref:hypothetical protein n=1 Tax=Microbispora bryophytorum TaxID=1460882 RepID=UPI003713516F
MTSDLTQHSHDEMTSTWNRQAIEALGPTTNVETAASVIGVSPWLVYELIRRGEWPVRALRLGRVIKIPTNDLIQWLYGGPDVAS